MRTIDFSNLGGFPLCQDDLEYLQTAYTETILALTAKGVNGSSPVIITGMVSSDAGGGDTDVSAGWFAYDGKLIRFPAQTYSAPGVDNAIYVVLTPTAAPLTFDDSSTPDVILDETGVLTELADTTPTDSTHFLLSEMLSYANSFGLKSRDEDWTTVSSLSATYGGTVSGTLKYKKCTLTNTLHIRGEMTLDESAGSAGWGGALPAFGETKVYYLPTDYRPAVRANIMARVVVPRRTSADNGWIMSLAVNLETDGRVAIQVVKTLADADLSIRFSGSVLLD